MSFKDAEEKTPLLGEDSVEQEGEGCDIKKVYTNNVLPMYYTYDSNMPKDLVIDSKDKSINAGAAFGYIEVSQGLANHHDVFVQAFALTHEASHIATGEQLKKFGIEGGIPEGKNFNSYKKAELLADLMATHLLGANYYDAMPNFIEYLDEDSECFNCSVFSKEGDFSHPSAKRRVKYIKEYAAKILVTEIEDLNDLFEEYFKYILYLDE